MLTVEEQRKAQSYSDKVIAWLIELVRITAWVVQLVSSSNPSKTKHRTTAPGCNAASNCRIFVVSKYIHIVFRVAAILYFYTSAMFICSNTMCSLVVILCVHW